MIIRANKYFLILLLTFCFTGCKNITPVSDRNSQLTQGNVQMTLKVGVTTKAEVIATFGSPNVTTRDGNGNEVWSYQRSAQVSQSATESGYFTVLLGGFNRGTSGMESTSRMITLIIKFNKEDIVVDFSSRTSNF
jgi:outer membrane protein assembly factor BamE (lipoprotein component of BamABCDE complex)